MLFFNYRARYDVILVFKLQKETQFRFASLFCMVVWKLN